jgi:hypothetical protein
MTAEPNTNHNYEAALQIAATGLKVVPIKPGYKYPPLASWQKAATTDPKTIKSWWTGLYRNHGVGIALGTQPDGRNIFAVDIDKHAPNADGHRTLAELQQRHGQLPQTVTSDTGADGQHLLFQGPANLTIRNQRSDGGTLGPGIDIRGEGGQIVVAPTIHPNGNAYQWAEGLAPWQHPIAAAPGWLINLVKEPERQPPAPAPTPALTQQMHPADQMREWWDWPTKLSQAGWTLAFTHSNGDQHWTRPGKDPRDGASAVLHPNGPFVVFTTEIPESLKQLARLTINGDGYSVTPFNFYAAYTHGGDTTAALQAISGPPVDLGSLIGPPQATQGPENALSNDELLLAQIVHWPTFYQDDHTAEDWLVQPILANGRSHAIFAPGGTGKSLLSLWLAVKMATGGTVFGNKVDPKIVLYLDYEMTAADLADRLDSMQIYEAATLTNLKYALLPSLSSADTPEGGREINRLAELVGAEVVVLDTFSRAVEGDENDADTVRSFYRWTGIHLKAAGRAFVRIDHAGKDINKGQRGTSAKNDDVDIVWQMTRTDQGMKLTAKKRRMGWVPEFVDLTMTDGPLNYDMAHRPGYPAGTKEAMQLMTDLGIDNSLPVRDQGRLLREAGCKVSNQVLQAAVKCIRQSLELNLQTEQFANRNSSGTRSGGTDPEHARYAENDGSENRDVAGKTLNRNSNGTQRYNTAVQSGTRRSIRAVRTEDSVSDTEQEQLTEEEIAYRQSLINQLP